MPCAHATLPEVFVCLSHKRKNDTEPDKSKLRPYQIPEGLHGKGLAPLLLPGTHPSSVSGHQLDLHGTVAVHNIKIRAIMVVEVGVMSEAIMMVAGAITPSKPD